MGKFNTNPVIRLVKPMCNSERFKFGTVTLPSVVLPSPEDVCTALEETPVTEIDPRSEDPAIQRHSVDAVVCNTDHDSDPYCHFQYRAAFSKSDTVRTPEQSSLGVHPWHVRSRVFYFEDGQFAVQPVRGLPDTWFPSFLGHITDTEVGNEFRIYGSEHNVAGIQRTPGGSPPSEVLNRVPAGDGAASSVSSSVPDDRSSSQAGDPADLLDELTRGGVVGPQCTLGGLSSDIAFEPDTVVATWDETDWPDDADEAKRATEIHRQIVPYLRNHV